MDLNELINKFPQDFEELGTMRTHLIAQVKVLEDFFFPFQSSDKDSRLSEVVLLLERISSECKAISILLPGPFLAESYIIARSMLEKSINYCYLLICAPEEYNNYLDYSKQKIVRTLYSKERALSHIGVKKNLPDISSFTSYPPLKKFTSPRGREMTRWTKTSLEDRVKAIKEKVNQFIPEIFSFALDNIYEDASEFSHGTLYGASFHTGVHGGISEREESFRFLIGLEINLFITLALVINQVLIVTNYAKNISEILRRSQENYKNMIDDMGKYKMSRAKSSS